MLAFGGALAQLIQQVAETHKNIHVVVLYKKVLSVY